MSVYQRFYVKTNTPRLVEQLIVTTLGGSGWLEPNDSGDLLRQVSIVMEGEHSIRPARDVFGNLLNLDASEGPSAKWYYLISIIDFDSVEAAQIALALYESPLVEMVAEDNEVCGNDEDAEAMVINSNHYLLHDPASGG